MFYLCIMNVLDDNSWRTPSVRQNVVSKIEEAIQSSGMQVARNSSEMENHVYMKAKNRDEYMNMVAKLILHVREMSQPKTNQAQSMSSNQVQQVPNQQVQTQGQSNQVTGTGQGLQPDPINALQNLASQGTRNQMMAMGPQGQMQLINSNSNAIPEMSRMPPQMVQQGPIVSQQQPQTATNLLQTLNQRPQLNMQQLNKLGGAMGMQGQMGGNMGMGMGNPMSSQLQSQLAGPGMQGQMMPNMSIPNSMQPMSGSSTMVQCNQVVGGMQGQMPGQMVGGMGGMGGNMNMNMLHHMPARGKDMMSAGYPHGARAPPPNQFLRQSPSPSAPGPSPASMGVMTAMASPMSMGALGVGSPSPSGPHMHHGHHPQQQRGVGMGMVASPSSSLNTPSGGQSGTTGGASPGGEEAAYRDKVRLLSRYIEPLRRMIHRMVSEGENVEKLQKMKNLLDILSNPSKRMPLETLLKCEVVLEKLDFKRSEGLSSCLPVATPGKEQIFNPLLEVVNNCLQSPIANHTLKRTFGSTLDALNGPEIKNLPPPYKIPKTEEPKPDIPDVLQGEIARLDSRFKVSLETMQLSGGNGTINLIAQLDDARLPVVPAVQVSVPRDYPKHAPARLKSKQSQHLPPDSFLGRLERAMDARCAKLPKGCSVGQLLDAWEMSVRQACAPTANTFTPVLAMGL